MDIIRLATPEETAKIAETADLSYATSTVTFGGKDFAVIRNCFELDPVIFDSESSDRRKLFFVSNLETAFRLQGIKEIYFNVKTDDETYLKMLDHWGAERVSPTPEFRYKKVL